MVVGNHQCNAANRNQSKPQFQLELSLAQFSPSLSEVCIKLKKIRGEHCKQNEISEIETYLGKYTGDNVLEGFRANTEYLCNEKEI